jgi:hypothetical protein
MLNGLMSHAFGARAAHALCCADDDGDADGDPPLSVARYAHTAGFPFCDPVVIHYQ